MVIFGAIFSVFASADVSMGVKEVDLKYQITYNGAVP